MAAPKRPLGAQISHALKARDVDTIFGIPGVHNVELYRGIEQAGIKHILARHEQGAGFMADGYARATGKPGVAYVISGPGLCNIMTPMGQAYSDSVPLLVVSSCLERQHLGTGRGRLHEMRDQEAAAASVCDWSRTAFDAQTAWNLLDLAFAEFAVNRGRPKHIDVPIDVLADLAEPAPGAGAKACPFVATDAVIADVAAKIAAARNPLIIFGGGTARASDSARVFLDRAGAACFTTIAGRGVIPADHPRNFGATLPRSTSISIIGSSDLVVAIGTELSECDLWRDHLGPRAHMIRVDIDAHVLGDWHRAETPLLSEAGHFMEAVAHRLKENALSTENGWDDKEITAFRASARAEAALERPGLTAILEVLRDALPAESLVYSDMTQMAYVANEVFPLDRPGSWHHPSGFGALGYALPAAIGGKFGCLHRPVVAVAGDYGFHYTMQELGVAVEHQLCLPIILWDNGKLKEIEDCMASAQINPNAVKAHNPDFVALAQAFGAAGCEPADLDGLKAAITEALTTKGPTLIRVTPAIAG